MTWPERFVAFFQAIQSPLSIVLTAHGCREGWIQGEMYRHFRTVEPSFRVNCSLTDKQTKFDIQCGKAATMVAELKVYGYCRYQRKNLHGGSRIARFIPKIDGTRIRLSLPEIRKIDPKSSYLNDVLRLHALPSNIERYLILVLQKGPVKDDFGKAITAVQVSETETEADLAGILVRISHILDSAPAVN